ncbi:MAG TPA: DUF2127 domain-containing protein [Acidobacteriaceae bacterium]|nr:DUF2127 domain-containing protein [Acidobacteriaceae bacterium]
MTDGAVCVAVQTVAPLRGKSEHRRWLVIIGALKLLKGVLFIGLGFALLRMLHRDFYMVALRVSEALRLDPERIAVSKLLEKATLLDVHRLKQMSALIFAYACLDFIEGTGLVLEKRWAEYFTLVLTTAFLPLEAIKLAYHPNRWTFLLLLINVLLVVYLAWLVRSQHIARKNADFAGEPI